MPTTYELQGIDPSGFQPMTEHLCNVAAESFRTAGFEVLTAEQMAASSEFTKLHATGQPAPYAYARAGTSYMTYAPAGQQIVDSVYLTKSDSMFSGFKAMSTDGPMFIEARLAKALQASPVHVNLMVDFAKLAGNIIGGLAALVGSGGKSYKTSRYGVMVDPVAFKDGASRLTQQFIGMGVALMRP